jgi:hypothetical protein
MTNTTNIESLISTFAKTNKVSKIKLTALVEECVAAKLAEYAPAAKVANGKRGRKPIDHVAAITAIREAVGTSFTINQAKEVWGITYIGAVKRMEKMEESGFAQRVGHNVEQNGLGRKADLWQFTI